jgi:hypothetical protein
MPEGNSYSSIGPLDAAAQKDAMPLVGMLLLAMIITLVALFILGAIVNML